MRKGNPEPLPLHLQAELEALAAGPDREIDLTDPDCPPTTAADWQGAIRGALFRAEKPVKERVSVLLDADVLAWFKQSGESDQTRIDDALRAYMMQHQDSRGLDESTWQNPVSCTPDLLLVRLSTRKRSTIFAPYRASAPQFAGRTWGKIGRPR